MTTNNPQHISQTSILHEIKDEIPFASKTKHKQQNQSDKDSKQKEIKRTEKEDKETEMQALKNADQHKHSTSSSLTEITTN